MRLESNVYNEGIENGNVGDGNKPRKPWGPRHTGSQQLSRQTLGGCQGFGSMLGWGWGPSQAASAQTHTEVTPCRSEWYQNFKTGGNKELQRWGQGELTIIKFKNNKL